MNNEPEDVFGDLSPDELPPGSSFMSVSRNEIDYLKQYWELKDNGVVFGWAVRLLYDLTKAEEQGWCLLLRKGTVDMTTQTVVANNDYRAAVFRLEWMMPQTDGYLRLPVDTLEKKLKILPGKEGLNSI